MTLDQEECWSRLAACHHGVLATVHARRGVDAVPVVFVLLERAIVIPVDRVKPERSTRLQRLVNLEQDGRCVLLVDHYEDDWTRLWWVRVHARAVVGEASSELVACLGEGFPAYRAPESVAASIVLRPTALTGWAAASRPAGRTSPPLSG